MVEPPSALLSSATLTPPSPQDLHPYAHLPKPSFKPRRIFEDSLRPCTIPPCFRYEHIPFVQVGFACAFCILLFALAFVEDCDFLVEGGDEGEKAGNNATSAHC